MNTKHTTKAESDAWKARCRIGSRAIRVIPSWDYNPPKKAPSQRDQHRADVAARKTANPIR